MAKPLSCTLDSFQAYGAGCYVGVKFSLPVLAFALVIINACAACGVIGATPLVITNLSIGALALGKLLYKITGTMDPDRKRVRILAFVTALVFLTTFNTLALTGHISTQAAALAHIGATLATVIAVKYRTTFFELSEKFE